MFFSYYNPHLYLDLLIPQCLKSGRSDARGVITTTTSTITRSMTRQLYFTCAEGDQVS